MDRSYDSSSSTNNRIQVTTEQGSMSKQKANPEQQVQNQEEPDDGVPIVLVTGASGFIATHLIQQLLEQGRYHVRGTVRSLKKEEKVNIHRKLEWSRAWIHS